MRCVYKKCVFMELRIENISPVGRHIDAAAQGLKTTEVKQDEGICENLAVNGLRDCGARDAVGGIIREASQLQRSFVLVLTGSCCGAVEQCSSRGYNYLIVRRVSRRMAYHV